MASRGHKRPESSEELPVDKRPCTSMGNNPSSSKAPSINGSDRATSSSPAASSSASDNSDHELSMEDQEDMKNLVPILNDNSDPSAQLVALTQLCEILSFLTESPSSLLADQLASVLVRLANHESSSDIMLFAIRAITYLGDVSSTGLALLVRHDVVTVLCQRLTVIEYLDVAAQCFQALKGISRDHPLACFKSGAIMAVLGFIDFFSTHIQRDALSIVVNICQRLPSACAAPSIEEAVPRLCDLLQYEDQQLVESAISCLTEIANRVKGSPERIKVLCEHGLVQRTVHLIGVNNQRTLSQTTYASLIGLLAKLVAGSSDAVSMIFELDIGSTLKDFFSYYDLSHGTAYPHAIGKHSNQLQEVLRFLNELLPPTRILDTDQQSSAKEKILADHPDGMQRFGMQVLPVLIQAINSGENLFVCYGFLSVISKLVYHTKSDMLLEVIERTGMASFLMGVFTRNDHHILTLALEITEIVLEKISDIVMASLAKEGIFCVIDALLTPEKGSLFMLESASGISTPSDFSLQQCLCYSNNTYDGVSTSESKTCKLNNNSVKTVARRIREKYVAADGSDSVDSDLLKNLREASNELNRGCKRSAEKLNSTLHRIMVLISGDEPVSTFELIESGIIKALINYLHVGLYEREEFDLSVNFELVLERFENFARMSLSSFTPALKDSPLCLLVQKLQIALSNMERFALTPGSKGSIRISYASIPDRRLVPHPCLRLRFERAEVEKDLGEYSEAEQTVDPFCSVEAIKSYLFPKIAEKGTGISETASHCGPVTRSMSAKSKGSSRLAIYLGGSELDDSSTLYQAVLQQRMKSQEDACSDADLWVKVYTLTYKNVADAGNEMLFQQDYPFSYGMVVPKGSSGTVKSSPTNGILFLLRSLEVINQHSSNLELCERANMFAKGKCNDLYSDSTILKMSQNEFVNSKLSEKLEQQMRNSFGEMPLWCNWLMSTCPFIFTLETRRRFFQLAAFGQISTKTQPLERIKFTVSREHILESATTMMDEHAEQNAVLEVEYHQEIGTGLGPTIEFYTLVCHEFQNPGLGMWRDDYMKTEIDSSSGVETSSLGLFPRPWSKITNSSDVIKRFSLLGWIMGKALQDGRVLDIPLSKAFFKLILGQNLSLYDILSFDPVFGKTLLEFHAISRRQKFQTDARRKKHALSFRGMSVKDLSLDFSLPGYPDYLLAENKDDSTVTVGNLKEYVSLVADATLNAGICKQVEAFKSGFNKVFPISHLRVFNEEELERLICGEHDSWASPELLDHCKIDHGYTACSTPVLYLVEILQDFSYEERRAFLQFVTGAPRLPPGGLGALNPRLTIVRKDSNDFPDLELPSVMTCTKYLKLPPYSSKEVMKEKLLYAIREGQGAFHLS